MTVIIIVFLCCVLFSIFYWQVFHAVLSRAIRYQLFSIRDEVRGIALENGLVHSFPYLKLERFVNDSITLLPYIGLPSFICFIYQKHPVDDDNNKKFQQEAPPEFHKLRDRAAKALLISMILNSPWAILFASLAAPALWALGKVSRFLLYRGAETYIDTIPRDAVPC
jgi:hypothetical protein